MLFSIATKWMVPWSSVNWLATGGIWKWLATGGAWKTHPQLKGKSHPIKYPIAVMAHLQEVTTGAMKDLPSSGSPSQWALPQMDTQVSCLTLVPLPSPCPWPQNLLIPAIFHGSFSSKALKEVAAGVGWTSLAGCGWPKATGCWCGTLKWLAGMLAHSCAVLLPELQQLNCLITARPDLKIKREVRLFSCA